MKIQIEKAGNGYILQTVEDDFTKTIVIQAKSSLSDSETALFTFSKLVDTLQEEIEVYNSKHNTIAFINGLCSCDRRWDIKEQMEESLKTPKNDYGD